ncbi:MAG: hypothetical protein Q7T33_10150 [Dehalococcoidia bacterium]|nr:hypothetical protein [Dehalococcoidia bacterium]
MKRSVLFSLLIMGVVATLIGARTSAQFTTSSSDSGVLKAGSIAITISDADGDWVTNALDNCPNWPNSLQNLPPWTVPTGDPDCDGFPALPLPGSRGPESFIGTDSNFACGVNAWPADLNDDSRVGLSDILAFIPVMGATGPGLPYTVRFDLNADNSDGLSDILMLIPFFNQTCTP